MPKRVVFIRFNTIKDYIKDMYNIRSDKAGTKKLISRFNSLIKNVIKEAVKLAKENRRKTVKHRDIKIALEQAVGKKHLNWQELLTEVLRQSPADLGKISKGINKHIETNKKGK